MLNYNEMIEMMNLIRENWGEDTAMVIYNAPKQTGMTFKNFLSYCTACGGNWGGMLLTGIQHFWPDVYDAIPNDMGFMAWSCICATIRLLGVDTSAGD